MYRIQRYDPPNNKYKFFLKMSYDTIEAARFATHNYNSRFNFREQGIDFRFVKVSKNNRVLKIFDNPEDMFYMGKDTYD